MRYVAVSGGADSTATALLLHERGDEFEMVFADTGAELPETYWLLPRLAQYVGKPLTVVCGGTFYQHLTGFGFLLPSFYQRWCTRLLKIKPQKAYLVGLNAEVVSVGIRADEPRRLGGYEKAPYPVDFPLVAASMGKADVHDLCRKHDLLSPVYQWRSNTSCFCCPFQRKQDWRGLLKHHPALYAMAEDWETQSAMGVERRYTWMGQGKTLADLREATERQLEFWPECPEEACTICQW